MSVGGGAARLRGAGGLGEGEGHRPLILRSLEPVVIARAQAVSSATRLHALIYYFITAHSARDALPQQAPPQQQQQERHLVAAEGLPLLICCTGEGLHLAAFGIRQQSGRPYCEHW